MKWCQLLGSLRSEPSYDIVERAGVSLSSDLILLLVNFLLIPRFLRDKEEL